jgi:DNA-binding IclR family transcriptional regulator
MARPVPGIERTVALLNFLAAHPQDRFSLSELCRRVGLSKATGHAQVNALADAGYLLRHPDKTFTLGPALVSLGMAAAERQHEIVELARDEMRRLSDGLGAQCVASAAIGDEMVLLGRAGPVEPFGWSAQVGARVPLVPPLGTVFLAWAGETEVEAWLRRLGPGAGADELDRYRHALQVVRRRGFALGLDAEATARLRAAVDQHDDPHAVIEELGHAEYVLTRLDPEASQRVLLLAAPVFGPDARVVLALTVFGFRDPLGPDDLARIGGELMAATGRITRSIGGRPPATTLREETA